MLGVFLPALGMTWHHHDLVNIYNKLARLGYSFVYLTARSFSEHGSTRSYLDGVVHKTDYLPRGPILMSPKSYFSTLRIDMVMKSADV